MPKLPTGIFFYSYNCFIQLWLPPRDIPKDTPPLPYISKHNYLSIEKEKELEKELQPASHQAHEPIRKYKREFLVSFTRGVIRNRKLMQDWLCIIRIINFGIIEYIMTECVGITIL